MTAPTPAALRQTAIEAGERASELLRNKFLEPRSVTSKGFRDLVTDADYASQALIAASIQADFPDHGFLTEEEDSTLPTEGSVTWIIDPVDGTNNYSRQVPIFGICIAAAIEDEVVAGVICDPTRNEIFAAAKGLGCTLNNRPVQVAQTPSLEKAIVSLDWARETVSRQRMFETLQTLGHAVHTMRSVGSAALSMAWIACGRLDAYLNFGAAAWDIAAGDILLREAGGVVTQVNGSPWHPSPTITGCAASSGAFHAELLATLAPAP